MTEQTKEQAPVTLAPFLAGLGVGNPAGHQNLTLVPLRGEPGRLEYVLAAEALSTQLLTISEVSEGGSVPELLASNSGHQMILLLDGEELVGAKQNRILNTTVLLPAHSRTKIPVSCVEQGRWHHVSKTFSSGNYSPSNLRARKSRDVTRNLAATGKAASNQGAVWDAVEERLTAAAVPSATMAMADVVENRRDSLEAYVQALPYLRDARGVIVAIDGRLAAMDLFDKPATLERIWQRLVGGYAMDAAFSPARKAESVTFTTRAATVLLEHLAEVPCQQCPTVGVGADWRFEARDIVGQALVVEGGCIHLSAFPNVDAGDLFNRDRGSRIQPPSARRRGHRPPDIVQ